MEESGYTATLRRTAPEDEYPLADVSVGLLVHVRTHVPLPPAATARLALREMRRMVGEMEARQLKAVDGRAGAPLQATPTPAPVVVDIEGLDRRIVRTAHRLLQAVAAEERAGGAALVSELTEAFSAPTLARFLDPATPAGRLVQPWLVVEPRGRTRALRLTPAGHTAAEALAPMAQA